MVLVLSLVCFFSCFGGILLAQSLKGLLIFKEGLEKGQRKMFNLGAASLGISVLLALISFFIPAR